MLASRLQDAVFRLNPDLPGTAHEDALRKLTRPAGPTLETRNRAFHRMLVDGIPVEYRDAHGRIRGDHARVLDFDHPANNDWLAVNQFTVVEGKRTRRLDVVLFVNGLPLGVIELKHPSDPDATVHTAWRQLQTYKAELPTLFAMNELMACRTASRPGSVRSPAAGSGSSGGAPSPGTRKRTRRRPSFKSRSKGCARPSTCWP